jgi:hypothetical protein
VVEVATKNQPVVKEWIHLPDYSFPNSECVGACHSLVCRVLGEEHATTAEGEELKHKD